MVGKQSLQCACTACGSNAIHNRAYAEVGGNTLRRMFSGFKSRWAMPCRQIEQAEQCKAA